MENVAVFWDYENCPVPSNASGYAAVDYIRTLAEPYGSVRSLKAYLEVTEQTPSKTLLMRSELQSSGVSLVDCPYNGRKDVADKMIIVDMLAHALDNPAPSTIILITGDRDFAYAMSILRLRRYRLVLVTLPNAHASLTAQASVCLRWTDIMMALPNDDTPSNVFEHVASPAPAPSRLKGLSFHAVTNSPRDMFNKLRPEMADHYKRPDVTETPRFQFAQPFPSREYTSEPSRPPLPVVERPVTATDNSWKYPPYPLNTWSPAKTNENPAASNAYQSESVIPRTESPFLRAFDRPSFVPTGIAISNSFPRPSSTSILSNPNGNAGTSITNEPGKPLYTEPSPVSGHSISTSQQNSLPTTQINSEPTVPSPVVPVHFKVLVECLQKYRLQGKVRPLRSVIGLEVAKTDVFKKVGVERFKQYATIAVKLGIVELGGKDGDAWIFLKSEWVDAK